MERQMTAVSDTPSNKNFLSPLNFQFSLKRAPHVNFFIQRVGLPSISIPEIEIPTMFNYIPESANELIYGSLDVTFKVDEDFTNYLEIHDWMFALATPESFEAARVLDSKPVYSGEGRSSDISLIVLNSSKKPNFEVTFIDAFPVALSGLDFDTTQDDVQYLTSTATFKYMLYKINKIS